MNIFSQFFRRKFSQAKRSVLLVEDNVLSARAALEVLNDAGCSASWVESGEAALRFAGTVDIVLIDFELVGLDGCATTRAFRSGYAGLPADVPVVVLTAHSSSDLEVFCRESGGNGVVTKPLSAELLQRIFNDVEAGRFCQPCRHEVGSDSLLDASGAMELLGLSVDEYRELLSMFLGGLEENVTAICNSSSCSEWQRLGEQAHSLKGESLAVGAHQCQRICEGLSGAVRDKQQDVVLELVSRLQAVCPATVKIGREFLNR